MKISVGFTKTEHYCATSLTDVCAYFNLNHKTVRNKLTKHKAERVTVKGVTVIKTELNKIQGRGGFMLKHSM